MDWDRMSTSERLRSAIDAQTPVVIVYVDSAGAATEREVLPVAFDHAKGTVLAQCRLRSELRTFTIARLRDVQPVKIVVEDDGDAVRVHVAATARMTCGFCELAVTRIPDLLGDGPLYSPHGGAMTQVDERWVQIDGEFAGAEFAVYLEALSAVTRDRVAVEVWRTDAPDRPLTITVEPNCLFVDGQLLKLEVT